jgi:hypothetical protein
VTVPWLLTIDTVVAVAPGVVAALIAGNGPTAGA